MRHDGGDAGGDGKSAIGGILGAGVGVGVSGVGAGAEVSGSVGAGLPPLQPLTYNVDNMETSGVRAGEEATTAHPEQSTASSMARHSISSAAGITLIPPPGPPGSDDAAAETTRAAAPSPSGAGTELGGGIPPLQPMTYNISESAQAAPASPPSEAGAELGGGIPPLQPVTYHVAEPVLPVLPSLNSVLVQSLVHKISAPVHQVILSGPSLRVHAETIKCQCAVLDGLCVGETECPPVRACWVRGVMS